MLGHTLFECVVPQKEAQFMRDDKAAQIPPRTIEDCFELILALRRDVERRHESQLAEFAVIKSALQELGSAMPAPEVSPTMINVETLPVNDPMKEEREGL